MQLISRSLFFSFFLISLISFLLVPAPQAEAFSHGIEFIVDFSESMKEKIDDRVKKEIVRELFDGILTIARQPLDAELIFFGHRHKDRCDDAEVVVPSRKFTAKTVRKKLSETNPQGKGGIISALKKAVERLDEKKDLMSIFIFTDGKGTCSGDILKTAREIREKYDWRVTFHVIGLNPQKKDASNLGMIADIGYGSYKEIQAKHSVKDYWLYRELVKPGHQEETQRIVDNIVLMIDNPAVHHPKVIGNNEMVRIPAGEFLMGSDSPGSSPNEHPEHMVYLDSFLIDRYEVTQQQYRSVTGENHSHWLGSDLPIHNVSWHDAKNYCEKVGKRLPTEAEWEKAAKGGKDDKWSGTSDAKSLGDYAWIDDTGVPVEKRSGGKLHPAGTKNPNGYGVYDMSGSLWEWVADWYLIDYYRKSPKTNPQGPEIGPKRVLRGGSWDSHIIEVRTAARYNAKPPEYKDYMTGFRCAKNPE